MSVGSNRERIHAAADGLPSRELFRQSDVDFGYRVDRWGAIAGLVSSLVAGLLGVGALAVGSIAEPGTPAAMLATIGAWLLVSVIPLLLVGAHCLDRLEDRLAARAAREAAATAVGSSARERGPSSRPWRAAST
jgi:hypothetical protein